MVDAARNRFRVFTNFRKRSLAGPFGAFTSSSEPSWMRRTLAKAISSARFSSPWQIPTPLVLLVHPALPL